MENVGISTRLLETAGAPVVFGEVRSEGKAPTLLIYGHYDVQPPEPLEAWTSPPFDPTVRNGRIYARGVGDNKGQLYAQLMGVKAHLNVSGSVPINVKFLFEGEEENGSTHLEPFVNTHKELLRSDLVYTSDGPVHESGRHIVAMGVRGMLYLELTAKCANRDLHSGNWGGPIPDAVWQTVELLSTLRDPKTGRVLLDGFYDKVLPITEDERRALRLIPLDRAKVARELGLDKNELPSIEEFYERLMFRPTLNICGFSSGYVGMGMKTIIPSTAKVKMDFRLVAEQNPQEIFEKLVRHIEGQTRHVTVKALDQTKPSRTPITNQYTKPIIEAVRQAVGEEPLLFPVLGGTLPDYVFTQILGLPSIMVPYANFDEMNHAPNENLAIANFVMGIKCCAAVLNQLSE